MAFSNTTSQTVFTTRRVVESSVRRCKIPAEQVTAEMVDIANDQLYLMLSAWSNQGIQLWCIQKQILPLYNGVGDVVLDSATVDILNANLRYLQAVSGVDTDTATTHTTLFSGDTFVSTVGVFWSAASVPIALERSADGVTWTTIQTETPVVIAGQWTWYDLASSVAEPYFRVRAVSGTLGFSQIYLGNTPTEIQLYRMNRDDYENLSNKVFQSNRPLQYWFDRQVRQPVMHLYPVPNLQATVYQLTIRRQRYIMDVGTLTQEIEVPQRWYEALVAGLAAKMALEIPEVDPSMIPILDQKAFNELQFAVGEERDNSPTQWQPNISMYTK